MKHIFELIPELYVPTYEDVKPLSQIFDNSKECSYEWYIIRTFRDFKKLCDTYEAETKRHLDIQLHLLTPSIDQYELEKHIMEKVVGDNECGYIILEYVPASIGLIDAHYRYAYNYKQEKEAMIKTLETIEGKNIIFNRQESF